jgi:hypothetical protein
MQYVAGITACNTTTIEGFSFHQIHGNISDYEQRPNLLQCTIPTNSKTWCEF